MNLVPEILEARKRLNSRVKLTALTESKALSELTGANVYLKHEEQQRTGSFKVRGAFNCMLALRDKQPLNEVVTSSTGNHAKGVTEAGIELGVRVTVFMSSSTAAPKISMLKKLGASIEYVEGDCLKAELDARKYANEKGIPYISPYNDPFVIAGQGTLGVELSEQLHVEPNAVYIAVGGGGLISGAGTYLKHVWPKVKIVGCWPGVARALYENLEAGKIFYVPEEESLSTSTAGNLEPGSITFDISKAVISDKVLVTEKQIADAMWLLREKEELMVEGAAGVAVAALLEQSSQGVLAKGSTAVVVLCGGNF